MTAPVWAGDGERFVDELLAWLPLAGASRYDPMVTQYEHAVQSAARAAGDGGSPEMVTAALLHDVGHLLVDEHADGAGFLDEDLNHEALGAEWLAAAFGPAVTEPIRLHVDAKRYLCGTEPDYARHLSAASARSLAVQGGPMSAAEAISFAARPHAAAAVAVRRIDDAAKQAGLAVVPAVTYRVLVLASLRRANERC